MVMIIFDRDVDDDNNDDDNTRTVCSIVLL